MKEDLCFGVPTDSLINLPVRLFELPPVPVDIDLSDEPDQVGFLIGLERLA